MNETKILSVKDFLTLVNQTLELIPADAYVIEGEVSDFRVSQGKWATFDLKDEAAEAKIPCFAVIFKLGIPIENGMRVRVRGQARIFERFGKFSLNVDEVIPVGEGALQKAYLALKKKLQEEGLFDLKRKRLPPRFPERIGLITSREAAAYGDFLRILSNRFGGIEIIHANVHVQGQYAVGEIVAAFQAFNLLPEADRPQVLVLTRGGGSLEDLHAFNDERVVRAVFSSLVPVIVGVGHERDESLCDFASDVRASTPSNAAELIVPDRHDLMRTVELSGDRMSYRLEQSVRFAKSRTERSMTIFEHAVFGAVGRVDGIVMRFSHSFDRFRLSLVATREHIERRQLAVEQTYGSMVDRTRRDITALERLLESVDPKRVLARGYSIVRSGKKLVRGKAELAPGDKISVQFAHDAIEAEVMDESQPKLL